MRLLDTTTYLLEDFKDHKPEPYVTLSHTWLRETDCGPDSGFTDPEVLYHDLQTPEALDLARSKPGWSKVEGCCRVARNQGFKWVWIDTCCIDKRSSQEVNEAIASMFGPYSSAAMCYTYLSDWVVGRRTEKGVNMMSVRTLPECRWFSRAWTLQELIASNIEFFGADWTLLELEEVLGEELKERKKANPKVRLRSLLSECANVDVAAITGRWYKDKACVADILRWASFRQATKKEDEAYSLLGLFGISMPIIYGEGLQSFVRLQEAILACSTDQSIFAWLSPLFEPYQGCLAPSLQWFKTTCVARIPDGPYKDAHMPFNESPIFAAVTSAQGIRLWLHVRKIDPDSSEGVGDVTHLGLLRCRPLEDPNNLFAIPLRYDALGSRYVRTGFDLKIVQSDRSHLYDFKEVCILAFPSQLENITIPDEGRCEIDITRLIIQDDKMDTFVSPPTCEHYPFQPNQVSGLLVDNIIPVNLDLNSEYGILLVKISNEGRQDSFLVMYGWLSGPSGYSCCCSIEYLDLETKDLGSLKPLYESFAVNGTRYEKRMDCDHQNRADIPQSNCFMQVKICKHYSKLVPNTTVLRVELFIREHRVNHLDGPSNGEVEGEAEDKAGDDASGDRTLMINEGGHQQPEEPDSEVAADSEESVSEGSSSERNDAQGLAGSQSSMFLGFSTYELIGPPM